jgi:histidinol-phosphate/aromatic aminotransferase/cobyric acid decarboxylase-like protein
MVNVTVDLSGRQPRWPAAARRLWARCAAEACEDEELWRRPARGGDDRLRAALASRYDLEPEHLTIVDGVRAAALALAEKHRRVVLHTPAFLGIRAQLDSRATVSCTPNLDEPLEPGDLLVLTSPARNPDGMTLGTDDHLAIAGHLDAGVRVLVNETYRDWCPDASRVPGAETMASFHKVAGVGARLGYVNSPAFLEDSVPHLAATEPPLIWQRTWALFLERDGMDPLVNTNVVASEKSAQAYDDALAELIDVVRPASGPHRLLPLSDKAPEQAVRRLAEHGYRAVEGTHFAAAVPSLRFCFIGVEPEDAAALPQVLDQLGLLPGGSS